MKLIISAILTIIATTIVRCSAQSGTVSLGLEYKPIFAVSFLRTGTQSVTGMGYTASGQPDVVQYNVSLNSGFNGGMVIRKSFTHLLTFETGISYVERNYGLTIIDGSHSESSQFQIIGYEIPVSVLVYAQTGEKTFANASMGISPDMFASDVQSEGENHQSYTSHPHFVQPAIIANLGWEFRTEESGYFYIGASFHGPFSSDFLCDVFYKQNGLILPGVTIPLSGNYLTIDFRFFFPPDTKNKKKTNSSD